MHSGIERLQELTAPARVFVLGDPAGNVENRTRVGQLLRKKDWAPSSIDLSLDQQGCNLNAARGDRPAPAQRAC